MSLRNEEALQIRGRSSVETNSGTEGRNNSNHCEN